MALSQSEVRRRIGAAMGAQPFSVSRAMQQLWEGGLRPGTPERDTCQELAEQAGEPFDAMRIHLPWDNLGVRTLTAGSPAGGGYLVSSDGLPVVNVANGLSLCADSGAVILSGIAGNCTIPRLTARPATAWLGTEETEITESAPTVGLITAAPRHVGAFVEGSRQLRVQSPELADAVLSRELAAALWLAIDTAAVSGTGANGMVRGLANTSGVDVRSGTSLSWATVALMRKTIVAAGARNVTFWGGPAAQETLSVRERQAGAGSIWNDAGIAGRPSFASPAVPDASLIVGDFGKLLVLLWGTPRLELNAYGPGFLAGGWQARMIASVDVVPVVPGCFSIAQSVT